MKQKPSNLNDKLVTRTNDIFWCPKGTDLDDTPSRADGWYFWDEVGQLGGGPYPTENEAVASFGRYCAELRGEAPESRPCISCGVEVHRCQWSNFENKAVVFRTSAGYGSRHDGDLLEVIVCDECVAKKARLISSFFDNDEPT